MHGVPQRPQGRDLRGRHQDRQRGRRDDDRPRIQPRLSRPSRAAAAKRRPPLLEVAASLLDRPAERYLASGAARARSSASAASTARASANCCWRCSACCAAVRQSGSTAGRSIVSPHAAKREAIGMALIPEDRKTEGLMLPMSVRDNLSFAALDRMSAAASSIARRAPGGRRDDRAARHPHRGTEFPSARSRAATSRKW